MRSSRGRSGRPDESSSGATNQNTRRKMVLVSLRPEIASSTPPSGGKGVEPFHFWIVTPPELRVSDDHVATR